jgi:hypothetical protein
MSTQNTAPQFFRSVNNLRKGQDSAAGLRKSVIATQIHEGDDFVMESDSVIFIRSNADNCWRATDMGTFARAKTALLMPLYQSQGADGFFLSGKCNLLVACGDLCRRSVWKNCSRGCLASSDIRRCLTLLVTPHIARWFVAKNYYISWASANSAQKETASW